MRHVWDISPDHLSAVEKAVLLFLAHTNDSPVREIHSLKSIGYSTGCSRRAVSYTLKELKDQELITVVDEYDPTTQKPNRYALNVNKLKSLKAGK